MLYTENLVSATEFVWSAANQVFVVEFFDRSALGFHCLMCGRIELCVHSYIVLSVVNQVFDVELCSPQRIRFSLSNLCGPHQIRCSLAQLRFSKQIRFLLLNSVNRSSKVFCSQILFTAAFQVFTAQICVVPSEIVLSVVNQVFAAECVVRSESGFGC